MSLPNPVENFFVKIITLIDDDSVGNLLNHPATRKTNRNINKVIREAHQSVLGLPGALELMSKLHGVYGQINNTVKEWSNSLIGLDSTLDNTIFDINNIVNTIGSDLSFSTNFFGSFNFANLGILELRTSMQEVDNLHPVVRSLINRKLSSFGYFGGISESVSEGIEAAFDLAITPLLNQPKTGAIKSDETTTTLNRKNIYTKMFPEIAASTDVADAKLDNLLIRKTRNNQFGKIIKTNEEKPIAHGYAFTNDIYHQERFTNSRNVLIGNVFEKYKDQLRLLDAFFPIQCQFDFNQRTFNVPVGTFVRTTNSLGDAYRTVRPNTLNSITSIESLKQNFEEVLDESVLSIT